MLYQPRRLLRLTSWSGQDKRLSIPTNIWLYEVTKPDAHPEKPHRKTTASFSVIISDLP